MFLRRALPFLAIAAIVAASAGFISARQAPPARAFSFTQVNRGRVLYQQKCASCHLPDMAGGVEAPPLAGSTFLNAWRKRTTSDLFKIIRETMPADSPGSLSNQDSLSLIAFILTSNGAAAGADDLTADAGVTIGDVATGGAPAAQSGAPGGAAGPVGGAPLGLTVEGEVKNYVPVTDEMLLHPDPADWLMVRGNYQAWNHSALKQITPQNVSNLRLAWVWSMNEGNANEPTPLVHNGIIYLYQHRTTSCRRSTAAPATSSGKIASRPSGQQGGGTGATRNLAIYQDKVFVATTDAHLVALDARTGKTVWDTVIADNTKGFGNSSGPIVIRGKVLQGMTGCDRYKRMKTRSRAASSAPLIRPRASFFGVSTLSRESGEPGGDTWGKLPNMLRAGGETWITGSYDPELNLTYWGVAQAKPWMQVSRGAGGRSRSLHQLHAGAASRRWKARLVFPARGWRNARSRRSVRARSGRHRRSQDRLHHRQGRHSLEARSPDRKISRREQKRFFRMCSAASIRKPASSPTGPDIVEQKHRQVGAGLPQHAKADTTGRR